MASLRLEEPEPGSPPSRGAAVSAGVDVLVSRTQPWTIVVSLVGEHDLNTAASLERRAVEHLDGCDRLVIDLSQTIFIDSSVINTLVRVARQARPRGVMFQVVAAPESHVHRVLALMGLLDHLGCIDRLPEMQAAQGDVDERDRRRQPAERRLEG